MHLNSSEDGGRFVCMTDNETDQLL